MQDCYGCLGTGVIRWGAKRDVTCQCRICYLCGEVKRPEELDENEGRIVCRDVKACERARDD